MTIEAIRMKKEDEGTIWEFIRKENRILPIIEGTHSLTFEEKSSATKKFFLGSRCNQTTHRQWKIRIFRLLPSIFFDSNRTLIILPHVYNKSQMTFF